MRTDTSGPGRVLCLSGDPIRLATFRRVLSPQVSVFASRSLEVGCPDLESLDAAVVDLGPGCTQGLSCLGVLSQRNPDLVLVALAEPRDLAGACGKLLEHGVAQILDRDCGPVVLRSSVAVAVDRSRCQRRRADLLHEALMIVGESMATGEHSLRLRDRVVQIQAGLGDGASWSLRLAALLRGAEVDVDAFARLVEGLPDLDAVVETLRAEVHPSRAGQVLAAGVLLEQGAGEQVLRQDRRLSHEVVEAALASRVAGVPQWVRIVNLTEGMVFAEDIRTADGVLLATADTAVTDEMRRRLWAFRRKVREPFQVRVGACPPNGR